MRGRRPEEATPGVGSPRDRRGHLAGRGPQARRRPGAHSPGFPPGAGQQGTAERRLERLHLELAAELFAHGEPRSCSQTLSPGRGQKAEPRPERTTLAGGGKADHGAVFRVRLTRKASVLPLSNAITLIRRHWSCK